MPAMLPLYTALDAETYGGAMLLGVDGVCIISHGSSSERAILNGINVAREMVEADVVGEISRAIRPATRRPIRTDCHTPRVQRGA